MVLMTCMPFRFVKIYKRHCSIVSLVHGGYHAIKVHIRCQSDSCIKRTCKKYEQESTGLCPCLCLFIDVGKWSSRSNVIYKWEFHRACVQSLCLTCCVLWLSCTHTLRPSQDPPKILCMWFYITGKPPTITTSWCTLPT